MTHNIAYQDELFLAGWSETHNGGAKVTFWVPDASALDVFRNLTTRKGNTAGQRFAAVLVEIGEDERPVTTAISSKCALMCKSAQFQQFVEAAMGYGMDSPIEREAQARQFVLDRCAISSRRDLDTSGQATVLWQQIQSDYAQWLRG